METKYFINKDKGTVVCQLGVDDFYTTYYITGKAKCSPDDTFDEETGKRIANVRAHIKYHQNIKNNAANELTRIRKYADNHLTTQIEHHNKVINNLKSVLHNL